MKVLSILKTKNVNHGGPPEVLRNQIKVINIIFFFKNSVR